MAVGDRDGMDDLDRLFRHLVSLLAEQEPDRLHTPFEVAELYQQILPYRQHRAALKLDTNQDYEMAVLRLLAGDREYATVEPGEVQDVLREEARAVNPDPGLFREYAAARVRLNAAAVRAALGARGAYVPATPPPKPAEPEPPPASHPVPLPTPPRKPPNAEACPYCSQELPDDRVAFYCPFCGGNVKGVECPKCGTGLEVGWTFCITCGQKVGRQ